MDVYVALSRLDSESFGVAIIEASACGIPVIVSNVGGLPEVVKDEETGMIVEKENVQEAGLSIIKLAKDSKLRRNIGKNGRQRVKDQFDWEANLEEMEKSL